MSSGLRLVTRLPSCDDLLIHPVRARVLEVGLERRPRGHLAAAHARRPRSASTVRGRSPRPACRRRRSSSRSAPPRGSSAACRGSSRRPAGAARRSPRPSPAGAARRPAACPPTPCGSTPSPCPSAGETISVFAPAWSSAFLGSVSSTCSKPSATRMATFFPCKFSMVLPPDRKKFPAAIPRSTSEATWVPEGSNLAGLGGGKQKGRPTGERPFSVLLRSRLTCPRAAWPGVGAHRRGRGHVRAHATMRRCPCPRLPMSVDRAVRRRGLGAGGRRGRGVGRGRGGLVDLRLLLLAPGEREHEDGQQAEKRKANGQLLHFVFSLVKWNRFKTTGSDVTLCRPR